MPLFGPRDIRFLETIAGQISAAVGRTELYARMADLAFQDPLTGVGNRRALEEQLELSAREATERGGDVAVLLADLDNLKELNDSLGHARGDQALAAVAAALTAEVDAEGGAGKAVYRLGGDEFCLLFTRGTAELTAHAAGERRDRPSCRRRLLSCDLGVVRCRFDRARSRPSGPSPPAADHALYVAKRTGRNRVCVADASHDAVSGRRRPATARARRHVRDAPVVDGEALLRVVPRRSRRRARRRRAVPAPASGRCSSVRRGRRGAGVDLVRGVGNRLARRRSDREPPGRSHLVEGRRSRRGCLRRRRLTRRRRGS